MTFSREEVAAFADGQLDAARHAALAAAIEGDPDLAEQVRAHRALRERLSAHFAPVMEAPLPDRLVRPLERPAQVVELAEARQKRSARGGVGWGWVVGPALAASLALVLFLPRENPNGRAEGDLAAALDRQLVAVQSPDAAQRILLSFRNARGEYCRAFTSGSQSGIACRETGRWRLDRVSPGAQSDRSDYRMAGNETAELLEKAQAMAVGPALDGEQELEARARGWR